jgi:hypothetical protein
MDDGLLDAVRNVIERSRRWRGFNTNQWVVLAVLGGLLLAIAATLVLILRSGTAMPASLALSTPDPRPGTTPEATVVEGDSLAQDLYWPPKPQLLAPPDAPGNRTWWDTRFAYRRAVLLDVFARRAPTGRAVEILWDGDAAVRKGMARADGADVRIVYWDGQWWHELERTIGSGPEGQGWRISFALVGNDEGTGRYHLYYGYPGAARARVPLAPKDQRVEHALVLALGPQEAVEWGPTVTWTAHSTATQTLVSPDGRFVFEHPAGGLRQDTRVRLRIVPVSERSGFGPLPDYELHADPPPGGAQNVYWDPPVTVSINWAGLPGDASSMTWVHFRHDSATGTWQAVPIEVNAEAGTLRFTTDQP